MGFKSRSATEIIYRRKKMNYLFILILFFVLYGGKLGELKEILPNLDMPSFVPVFKLLGMDDKTISLLTSDKFAEALQGGVNLKTLLPVFMGLMNGDKKENGQSEKEKENDAEAEVTDVDGKYFSPVKTVIPDDVAVMFGDYFGQK